MTSPNLIISDHINLLFKTFNAEKIFTGEKNTLQMKIDDAIKYVTENKSNLFQHNRFWLMLNVTDHTDYDLPTTIINIKCWIQMGFYHDNSFIFFVAPVRSDDFSKINDIYHRIKKFQEQYSPKSIEQKCLLEKLDDRLYVTLTSIARFFRRVELYFEKLDTI